MQSDAMDQARCKVIFLWVAEQNSFIIQISHFPTRLVRVELRGVDSYGE